MPAARISWVVQDDFAQAIEAHPALDEVIAFPRRRFGSWWRSPNRTAEVGRWFKSLRSRKFDIAIDCQGLGRSGMITRASGAPLRIGLRSAREFAWLCYNRRVPADDRPLPAHTVDQMLSLLEPLGVPAVADMRLYASQSAIDWWTQQRMAMGFAAARSYAVIAPGSRWLSKRWPIERFADLIEPLVSRGFERIVIVGSASEREQIQPLIERFRHAVRTLDGAAPETANHRDSSTTQPIIDLVGLTSIAQTMSIIAEAGLVIANDSAPLHMAVGFDRPCVALFGPTNPQVVGPYARAECVVRAWQPTAGESVNFKNDRLGDSLMRLISTTLALQAVDRVLALWPGRSQHRDSSFASAAEQRQSKIETRAATAPSLPAAHRGLATGQAS